MKKVLTRPFNIHKYVEERDKREPGFKKLVEKEIKKLRIEEKRFKIPTTPAINLLKTITERNKFSDLVLKFYKEKDKNIKLVDLHKQKFGKQDFCWNGEYRFWIWEFEDENGLIRVFVNNSYGASFEVSEKYRKSKILESYENYLNTLLKKEKDK